jgi:hypothetical protein
MTYRPEWFPKEDILGISLDVVCFIRGSYETVISDHENNVRSLEWIVKNWDHNYDCKRKGDQEFDSAILNVVEAALRMEKEDRKRRGY